MMKNYILSFSLLSIVFFLISWGYKGHQAVGMIAEKHLTSEAKEVIKRLLGNERVSDVASWADEVVHSSAYKTTASWHYLNLPLGLDYNRFERTVKSKKDAANIYNALLQNEEVFTAVNSSYEQRKNALKFIIHLVGDMHQPMHVSRAEDKGGNKIQVQFDGKGLNLHSLWDSRLIESEGFTAGQMGEKYDMASAKQIRQWQSDDVIKWLFESYQISSRLYTEIEISNKLDQAYYQTNIPIVHQRIEMAGIRLAGLLNELCKNLDFKPAVDTCGTHTSGTKPVKFIRLTEAGGHIGELVKVEGTVYGIKAIGSMVFVNLGAAYPEQLLTVVLKGNARQLAPELTDKVITVEGSLTDFKGRPEIQITYPDKIKIKN